MSNPIVTIEMENGGIIRAELYPEVAPNTVRNFVSLAGKGFYDGTIFHRVIPGFMIQGGDPDGTGMGGPGYEIRGEFTHNGFQNDLLHTRGVLYTAITRARELLLLVGNEELIAQMTQNNRRNKRYSGLRFRLQGEA